MGCHTGTTDLTTGWMFVYTMQPVVQPVVQPAVSCKRSIRSIHLTDCNFFIRLL